MCAKSKILTGLLERRALEAAIAELAGVADPDSLAERAEAIAQQGNAILPALIAALDTNDPQLRGGLGQVAVRLPRQQVVAALHGAARAPQNSAQARLTALTILERFFDEPPDEALLASLHSSDEIALQSLDELVRAMAQDPLSILEYLGQLGEQPAEVQRMILEAIPAAPYSPHLVTLLRMLAQDPQPGLGSEALEQLGRMRTPAAARALAALAETLPPALAALAARGLRKLRMSGVTTEGDPAEDVPWFVPDRQWRALMSPVDGLGAQLLWFIGQAPAAEQALVVSVVLEDARGLAAAAGSLDLALANLPPARPAGVLHRLAMGEHAIPLLLLEIPFEAGRRALRAALAQNWASGTAPPLAYRLLNLPLWLVKTPAGVEASSDFAVGTDIAAAFDTSGLLDHPAFWSWFLPVEDVGAAAAGREPDAEQTATVTRLIQSRFPPVVVASYQRRLRRMAEWLALAGDTSAAASAQAAADQLGTLPPEEVPFLRRLVDISLQAAGSDLNS